MMLALLDVNPEADRWHADFLYGDDLDWIDRPPSEQKWRRWLAPAIAWQAMRGGGTFIAVAPI